MKFLFVFLFIVIVSIALLVIKSKNSDELKKSGKETTGLVVEVFSRGKLPFCKFSYTVHGKQYIKKQDIQKHRVPKILNKTYTVIYEADHPENALILLKKEINE